MEVESPPRRLYNRENELAQLESTYKAAKDPANRKNQFVFIHGSPGVGKTTLAETLAEKCLCDNGYFIKGKFDSIQMPEPYVAFASALTCLVDQVCDRGPEEVRRIRSCLEQLEGDVHLLVELVPALKRLLVKDTIEMESPLICFPQGGSFEINAASIAAIRLKMCLNRFVKAVSHPSHPLVLLLDDIHHADEITMDLLATLVMDGTNHGCLILSTCRTEERAFLHSLVDKFALYCKDVALTKITLRELDGTAIGDMVAEIFAFDDLTRDHVVQDVVSRTGCNAFLARHYLYFLSRLNVIYYDNDAREWTYDEHASSNLGTVNDIILTQVEQLPPETKDVLRIACCLGLNINESILVRLVCRDVSDDLRLLTNYAIVTECSGSYSFVHECIQTVLYSLLSAEDQSGLHYRIGKELWLSFDMEQLQVNIFIVLYQLMKGKSCISKEKERIAVAKLCLRGGEIAAQQSTFHRAYYFLMFGVSLIEQHYWGIDYRLCVDLLSAASEVAYCTGHFETVEKLTNDVLLNARRSIDALRIRRRSTPLAVEALLMKPWTKTSKRRNARVLRVLKKRLSALTNEEILRLPQLREPEQQAAICMLNTILVYASHIRMDLLPPIMERMITLTLDDGFCASSGLCFSLYAMITVKEDIDHAYRFGLLGQEIQRKFKSPIWLARAMTVFYGTIFCWKHNFASVLDPLIFAHRLSLASGDTEYAMISANLYCLNQLDIRPIAVVVQSVRRFRDIMRLNGQELSLAMLQPVIQLLLPLSGRMEGDFGLLSDDIQCSQHIGSIEDPNNAVFLWSGYVKMVLKFLFGDIPAAFHSSKACEPLLVHYHASAGDFSVLLFFRCLTLLSYYRTISKTWGLLNEAKKLLCRLREWVPHAPTNFLGKLYLLEAELFFCRGDYLQAYPKYESAISLSKEGGFFMLTALACERTGKFFIARGNVQAALPYIHNSLLKYEEWGGFAKAHHLRAELKDFLDR